MPVVAYIADVHVGNYRKWGGAEVGGVNERCRHVLNALEAAVAAAVAEGAIAVGILGDLFDTVDVPPQVIAEVQRILSPVPTFALVGNHDMASTRPGDNTLAPLRDHTTVVETPTVIRLDGLDIFAVPFQPGPPAAWLPGALEQLRNECPLSSNETHLCLHMGVSDASTPYFLDGSSGSINVDDLARLMDVNGIDEAFAGDWHRHRVWECVGERRRVVQVGCLAPNRFPPGAHEHGHIGPMVLARGLDDDIDVLDVPGPRFVKLAWRPGDAVDTPPDASPLYIKLCCAAEDAEAARAFAKQLPAREVEVSVDRTEAAAAAREASRTAASASSVDEALQRYVAAMPLDPGVSREAVLRAARGYLR